MPDLPAIFNRLGTDDSVIPCPHLEGSYSAAFPAPVFLIGGGPSLTSMPVDLINRTPAPKFCMNLAGSGKDGHPPLIRPNLWSSYDPSVRFHKSIYLDPSIQKFVCRSRRMDLIPDSLYKVCDAPNLFFFDRKQRGYRDFIGGDDGIVDCRDTFAQCLDICYRLGFRTIYLLGTEMQVSPSHAQIEVAREAGVKYDKTRGETTWHDPATNNEITRSTLADFVTACRLAGLMPKCSECDGKPVIGDGTMEPCATCGGSGEEWKILQVDREEQYAFSERKPFQSAISTDNHYFTVAQHLRLARRSFVDRGLRIISCTPRSRLNDIFEYVSVEQACLDITRLIGDPLTESTAGLYTGSRSAGTGFRHTRDIPPYRWDTGDHKGPIPQEAIDAVAAVKADQNSRGRFLNRIIENLDADKSKAIEIEEVH